MNSKRLGAVALVLVLAWAGILIWGSQNESEHGAPIASGGEIATQAQPEDLGTARSPSPTAETGPEPADASSPREIVPDTAADSGLAVLRGRVIDEDSAPLAGVAVKLGCGPTNRAKWDAYVREHGDLDFKPPEQVVTSADGRFELRFRPPPPLWFDVGIRAEGFVALRGRWDSIAPGTVKDFGDLVLARGALVTGRVVDRDGTPVLPSALKARVALDCYHRADAPTGEIRPDRRVTAAVSADGTFAFGRPIRTGTWNLEARELLLDGDRQTAEIVHPTSDIRVVVHQPGALLRAIGTVVDDNGLPIARVSVQPQEIRNPFGRMISTDEDGRFEIVCAPTSASAKKRFTIVATRQGYQRTVTESEVGFGDHDIRIVMKRVRAMEVLVVRDDDGTPVEEYGIRVLNLSGTRSSSDRKVIDGWKHPDGITSVTTLQHSGEKRICVEAPAQSGLGSKMVVVEVDLDAPPRVTVRLPASIEQPLLLRDTSGLAVANSTIELIEVYDAPLTASSLVTDFGSRSIGTPERGLVLARAITDEDGRCSVTGPINTPLTLRCTGAHVPLIESGLVLSSEQRELTVPGGATLRVRIDPPDTVAIWRRSAGLPAVPVDDAEERRFGPKVQLMRSSDAGPETFPTGDLMGGAALTMDGAVLEGVPPGTWMLIVGWTRQMAGSQSRSGRRVTASTNLVFHPGDTREFVFDASLYQTGTVSGELFINGERARDGQAISLFRNLARLDPTGRPVQEWSHLKVGTQGKFAGELDLGTWHGSAYLSQDGVTCKVDLVPPFSVVAGQESNVTLNGRFAQTELVVLSPAGAPAEGIELYAKLASDSRPLPLTTDAMGRAVLAGSPGTYALSCRIRSLNDTDTYREAFGRAMEAAGRDFQAARTSMGSFEIELPSIVIAAETTGDPARPIEIRLPPEWDR